MTAHVAAISKKAFLCCLFCCCFCNVSFAQPSVVDSLKRLVSLAKDDTSKVWRMISLADAYSMADSRKKIEVLDSAKHLAARLNYVRGVASSERWIGSTYRGERNFEDAITHLREALRLYRPLGNVLDLAATYHDLGRSFAEEGRMKAGLDTCQLSRSLYLSLTTSSDSGVAWAAKNGVLDTYLSSYNYMKGATDYQGALELLRKWERAAIDYDRQDILAAVYRCYGATYYVLNDFKKTFDFFSRGLAIADRLNLWRVQHSIRIVTAGVLANRGEYVEAQKHLLDDLDILNAHEKDYSLGLAQIYRGLADIEIAQGEYLSAMEHSLRALKVFEIEGSPREFADMNMKIGSLFLTQGDFDDATIYLNKALELFRRIHFKDYEGAALFELGKCAFAQHHLRDAFDYHSLSLSIRRSLRQTHGLGESLFGFGSVLLQMSQREADVGVSSAANGNDSTVFNNDRSYLDSAAILFKEGLEIGREASDEEAMANCLRGLSRVEIVRKDWRRALEYLERSISLVDSLRMKKELYESYALLAEVSARLNRFDESYRYHRLYSALKDSVYNETSSKQIKETRARYETEKKDHDIESLNHEKEIAALKLTEQQLALQRARLEAGRKESDIKLLNQAKELQHQQLLNASNALTKKELEAKTSSAELDAAHKDQLLQEHNLQEQRLVMYGSIAFAALTIAFGIVLFNRFQLRKELDKRSAILEERRRISSDMHDDLGSSLSTIALLSQVMKQNAPGKDVEKISTAAQQSLERMGEIVWSLNPRNDKLENLVAYIRKYAMEYLDNSPVRCSVTMSGNIPDAEITGEQRRNVFLTVKESLHNIIKHSGATQAKLAFEFVDHTVLLAIHDNGKGIDTAAENVFGNGIMNMQRRMKEAGGEMVIENKEGTTVRLRLPVA